MSNAGAELRPQIAIGKLSRLILHYPTVTPVDEGHSELDEITPEIV